MKLRIKGNSLRLRVTRPELDALLRKGSVEETMWLGADARSRLTYKLKHNAGVERAVVEFNFPELAVVLPTDTAEQWRSTGQVGIYSTVDLGPHGPLELIVEKDFACEHGNEAENSDAFPNPHVRVAS